MPSSSLFLRSSTTLVSILSLASVSVSAVIPAVFGHSDTYYALESDYSGDSFFDGFTFNSDPDLTHGFVTYAEHSTNPCRQANHALDTSTNLPLSRMASLRSMVARSN